MRYLYQIFGHILLDRKKFYIKKKNPCILRYLLMTYSEIP